MGYQTIIFERTGNVATVTLNTPEAMNGLNHDSARDMGEAFSICELDPEIRAVILTGSGRAFSAGGDMRMLAQGLDGSGAENLYRLADSVHERVIVPIRRMAKPVICAVNGVAAGGGLGMVFACDLRVAAAEAKFTLAYSKIGLSPDCGATYFLPRLVGLAKATELYLLNDVLSADEALRVGLVNKVVPGADLMSTSLELAQRLAEGPSFAYGQTKRMLNTSFTNDLSEQLHDEARAIGLCASTQDHKEGVQSFQGKRQPKFVGH